MSNKNAVSVELKESIKGQCYHCGDRCGSEAIHKDDKDFCCRGCLSVYELLSSCGMDGYYQYASNPGIKQLKAPKKEEYAYLDAPDVVEKLLDFKSDELHKVRFRIPAMHCASCIWLIENFQKLVPGVLSSRVNFVKRQAQFSYDPRKLSLRRLVEQLAAIAYTPEIQAKEGEKKSQSKASRRIINQIGVAGFCFGNIMLLSLPEYFNEGMAPTAQYRYFFGMVNLVLSLPVLLFSAQDYLLSAFRAVKRGRANLDVPISLGILALWIRSAYEILFLGGGAYMDSLAALVFFLLIGKWFQQRTYDSLSFERDFRSYFPISVQKLIDGKEQATPIEKIKSGDRFRIRSGELVPADAIICEGEGSLDYSFVTGESDPMKVALGEKIFAGGRQMGAAITLEALKAVDQSYLTSLWNEEGDGTAAHRLEAFADRVGRKFTYAVLLIATLSTLYWISRDMATAWNVLSAVLIIACPCALALSFPFAYGSAVRYLGRKGLYLKNGHALGKMAEVSTIVFDKTGTLTHPENAEVSYFGTPLTANQEAELRALARQSGHPLSRHISHFLESNLQEDGSAQGVQNYHEESGLGIAGRVNGKEYKLGAAHFAEATGRKSQAHATEVHLSIDGDYIGFFAIRKSLREGAKELIVALKPRHRLYLLSGDNDSSRAEMVQLFDQEEGLHFNQSPHDKKAFLRNLRKRSEVSAMIGDGLNDAGALSESDFGISVADDVFRFTPASDAILDARSFADLPRFFWFSKGVLQLIKLSFVLSFAYNAVGIYFAVQGLLEPVIAAILMPLSSISVVGFVALGTRWLSRQRLDRDAATLKTDKNHVWN